MLNGKIAMALAATMVLAVLYGCSSNGVKSDRDNYRDMAEELQGQVDDLTAQLDQANADLMTAQGQVTTLQGQVSEKDGEISTLTTARDDLQTQLDDLTMNGRAEDQTTISNLQGQITDLNNQIMTLEGEKSDLETQLDAKTKELADKLEELEDERLAREAKEASDTAEALFGVLIPDADPAAVVAVSVKASSAGEFTASAEDYEMAEGYADTISGLRGRTLTMDGETIVVYSDIENAKATPIGGIYASAADPGKTAVYLLTDDGADNSINWSDAKRADDQHSTEGAGADAVTTYMGSVRGVDGTFSCTGVCTPPVGETAAAGSWTFQPANANANIDVVDSGYTLFGWWLDTDDQGVPVTANTFTTVVGMTRNTVAQTTLSEAGSATYRGGAAGQYAIKSTTEDTTEGGHFTANATVVANFEAGAAGDEISIKGTLSDFMTGATARPSWSVSLTVDNQTADNLAPVAVGDDNNAATWKTGGAVDGTGTWSAAFYGSGDDDEPTAVAGEFTAAITDIAKMEGAFSASK